MSAKWSSINDTYPLSTDDQVRISCSFNCSPLSKITAADIRNFLITQRQIKAVLDVEEGWIDSLTLGLAFECSYTAYVNPQMGMTAGDVRSAMYKALQEANETHTVRADDILVGVIERLTTSIIPSAPETTTAISLAAVAVVALVVLVLFLKISD